ncbi:MAG: 3-oxoacyl-ACP reductase, partial [Actinomycetota bacterium]
MSHTHQSERVAIVTGAADGIGAGIVRRLVEDGVRVVAADIDVESGAALQTQFGERVRFVRTDVTSEQDIVALVASAVSVFGTVDILVNNAWGGGGMGRVEYKTNELLQHGLDMAFYAAFWAMRECFPIMKAQSWGRVINMCSLKPLDASAVLEAARSHRVIVTVRVTVSREPPAPRADGGRPRSDRRRCRAAPA